MSVARSLVGCAPPAGRPDASPWGGPQVDNSTGLASDDDGESSSGDGSQSDASGSTSSSAGATEVDGGADESSSEGSSGAGTSGTSGDLDPPAGGSSGGSGGGAANGDVRMTVGGTVYRIIAPANGGPSPLLVVFSGTEGGDVMTSNLLQVGGFTGAGGFVFAVLDGVDYYDDGAAGADALDDVRARYDIDNDRTYLLSESAGTTAGLQLGLALRQSYFAAYWANDVNASAAPMSSADDLGFAPWGNAGPGGDFPDADAIVSAMESAGYRIEPPAPYDGPGADMHGATDQFLAALQWFPGKTRQ